MNISTGLLLVFFGTNTFLWVFLHLVCVSEQIAIDGDKKEDSNKKSLSKPFTLRVDNLKNLSTELLKLGFIMGLTYVCENEWLFPHSQKEYNRDLFLFVHIIFFAYAWLTIKPTKDLTLLSRDQTEEWKGWMQFIFLLYHCTFVFFVFHFPYFLQIFMQKKCTTPFES